MTLTLQALREAMRENAEQPEGPARNARAERLLSEAERTGERPAVIAALGHQLQVYNYSSEKAKMFVPFSRLLGMWDENPADFDAYETHSLHWVFKWVSSGMLDQPHIPLASIEKWLGEMERRYRLAGHSERAVRQGEFRVARHIGDRERAARAYAAWLAADRDRMADCHACELHGQGAWSVELGDDEQALKTWAPVLDGEHACAHEPHAVLASSLLPLVRLGRAEEARTNHLRGYRLVRPMESMRDAVALHIEFCALTGNEARGLEILAERPGFFTDRGDPDSHLDFLAVTALLTDRLVALGHGGQSVPGPAGSSWTAGELAGHARVEALAIARLFDERNGTGRVGEAVRERMARAPLMERLPLGVRAAGPVPLRPPVTAAPTGSSEDLLARARRLSKERHPDARAAWDALGRAVAAGRVDVDVLARAELDDHRAMALEEGPAESVRLFLSAAEGYEAAGDPGEAEAARARCAYALALGGRTEEASAAVEEAIGRVLALHAEGAATARQAAGALLIRVRVRLLRLHEAEGGGGGGEDGAPAEEVARSVDELLAFASPYADDRAVADRVAEAESVRADLAAHHGDAEGAARQYAYAAELYHRAGMPWYAVEPETRLSRVALHLGDLGGAERAARAALDHGAGYAGASGQTRLRLQLAEVLAAGRRFGEAVEHALEAAHWADEAGESRGIGAYARHLLGGWLVRESRTEEAAAILEAVLPDLSVEEHGDGAVVQTLWWLGDCLMALNEPRSAAEQWLRAAELAKKWPEQRDHAMLANLAAQALLQAELKPQAAAAYERAGELWRELGDAAAYVRTLRVRAWIAGAGEGRALMDAAAEACGEDVVERADTYAQTAELLAEKDVREALSYAERAVSAFAEAEAGPGVRDRRTAAQLLAAWLHLNLENHAAAATLARGVLAEYAPSEEGAAAERRGEAEAVLERAAT
ncbi:tetratricopeptide repeat protein [Streptomyces vilmorinianum]|uniref:tetratricopeptide repeat protein n=1 Tax=Streptomyces vilmorinianum TaxID=3051092 RepID=UPI0010FB308F|nr:tetratricopeptide repeat protein [Streptomyces vilmorinianum]